MNNRLVNVGGCGYAGAVATLVIRISDSLGQLQKVKIKKTSIGEMSASTTTTTTHVRAGKGASSSDAADSSAGAAAAVPQKGEFHWESKIR